MITINPDFFMAEDLDFAAVWERISLYCHNVDIPIRLIDGQLGSMGNSLIFPNVVHVDNLSTPMKTNISIAFPDLKTVHTLYSYDKLLDLGNIEYIDCLYDTTEYMRPDSKLKMKPIGDNKYSFTSEGYSSVVKITEVVYF